MSFTSAAATALLLALSPGSSGDALPICYSPPVVAPVMVAYDEPDCPYCAGQRGIEYGTRAGERVVAGAAGEVTFAGIVVGVRYVVVRDRQGGLASYGMLAASSVRQGQRVRAGQIVGTAGDRLYFGLRRDGRPVDPTLQLATARRRARLIPNGARPGRPAGVDALRCPAATASDGGATARLRR